MLKLSSTADTHTHFFLTDSCQTITLTIHGLVSVKAIYDTTLFRPLQGVSPTLRTMLHLLITMRPELLIPFSLPTAYPTPYTRTNLKYGNDRQYFWFLFHQIYNDLWSVVIPGKKHGGNISLLQSYHFISFLYSGYEPKVPRQLSELNH